MSSAKVDYVALMHQRGFRLTPQRQMILDAVCAGNGQSSADEILERAHAIAPSVRVGTVYRNLDLLRQMRRSRRLKQVVGGYMK